MDINILKLKEKFNLTLNEENDKIYVFPLNKYDFISSPLPENLQNCILITAEEYTGFLAGIFMFDENFNVTDFVEPTEEEVKQMIEQSNQMQNDLSMDGI